MLAHRKILCSLLVLPATLLALSYSSTAYADTLYVTSDAGDFGNHNCYDGECTIYEAIEASYYTMGADSIHLQRGMYISLNELSGGLRVLPKFEGDVSIYGYGSTIDGTLVSGLDKVIFTGPNSEAGAGTIGLYDFTVKNFEGRNVIDTFFSDIVLDRMIFEDNDSSEETLDFSSLDSVTVRRTTIRNNSSGYSTFNLSCRDSSNGHSSPGTDKTVFRIENTSIVNNTAESDGGGLRFARYCEGEIVNTTISGNYTSADGGGIAFQTVPNDNDFKIVNSTIVENHAEGYGGGLYSFFCGLESCPPGPPIRPVLKNTIVLSNTADNGNANDMSGVDAVSAGHNLLHEEFTWLGTGVDGGPLAQPTDQIYTPPTSPFFFFTPYAPLVEDERPGYDVHPILWWSQARNNADFSECLSRAQNNFPRLEGACDIGATEHGPIGEKGITFRTHKKVTYSGQSYNEVGCSGCDPYDGDFECSAQRPILCIQDLNLPKPNEIPSGSSYTGWSGGEVRLTRPVYGYEMTSEADGHNICLNEFWTGIAGPIYRMAEFHDSNYGIWGGWNFWAEGELEVSNERNWVWIDDQNAHCWD